MSNKNPKRNAIVYHKLAVLSALMLEAIDEVKCEEVQFEQISKTLNDMQKMSELIIENIFKVEEVKTSTYFNDLVNKVDTVIRKSFQKIPL